MDQPVQDPRRRGRTDRIDVILFLVIVAKNIRYHTKENRESGEISRFCGSLLHIGESLCYDLCWIRMFCARIRDGQNLFVSMMD